MTDQQQAEVLVIKQEKENNSSRDEENSSNKDNKDNIKQSQMESKKEDQKEIDPKRIEVQKNEGILNTEEKLHDSNTIRQEQANIQLQLEEKNIYQLPQDTISKLNISPCTICQSQNFLIYIPDPSPSPSPEKAQMEKIEAESKKPVETDTIKTSKNQNLFLPILICEQKHQFCLICHQNPHINSFCSSEYMNADSIASIFNFVKESVPEEKKDIFNILCNSALSNCQNTNNSNSCCTCKCTWSIIFLIFGLILWTAASVALVAIGLAFILLSLSLRLLCCCYHFWYRVCCTQSTQTHDRGSYIEEVTTVYVGRQRADEAEAEEHDECLASCGPEGMVCALALIPKGYKKVLEIFNDIRD